MLNKDNTIPDGAEKLNSVSLFGRSDGAITDQVIGEILDIHSDAWQYLNDNNIKVSMDIEDSPREGATIFFDDGSSDEITVSTFKHPCEEVMDAGVTLLKARQAA